MEDASREPYRSVYQLLDHLRKRPGMFLGTSSIETLEAFLSGLSFAHLDGGDPSFWDFKGWLAQRVPGISTSFPTTWLAQQHGAAALSKYFEFLDEYRRCSVVTLQRCVGPFAPTFTIASSPDFVNRAPATPSEVVVGQFVPSEVFFVDVKSDDQLHRGYFKTLASARADAERHWGILAWSGTA